MYLLIVLLWTGEAVETRKLEELEQRIMRLEASAAVNPKPATTRDLDLLTGQVAVDMKTQANEIQQKWNHLDNGLQRAKNRFDLLTLLGGLSLLVLLAKVFWWLPRQTRKTLAAAFEGDRGLIAEMVKRQDINHQIRTSERLLVLCRRGKPDLKSILVDLGFRPPRVVEMPEGSFSEAYIQDLERDIDLVIFDRLDQDTINRYMALGKRDYFVGYTQDRLEIDLAARINFANSPMTLYNRILDVARYGRLMAAKKS